jgi:RNA polymerase primary sigma factor
MTKKYIDVKEDGLNIYMKDVRKSTTIKVEEEIELAKRIKEGDETAISELVNANLRFVVKIAKEYQNQGVPVADLISEGNYGLITAAKKFDHTRGFKFISYAVWWIKQSILQSLNEDSRTVRLPANMINKLSKIRKEIENFEKDNQREPFNGEVEQVNVPNCTSLNTIINEDGDELVNMIHSDLYNSPDIIDEEEIELKKNELNKAMRGLSQREIEIINCYYGINGEPMTLEMIGEELDLTKERIRQIKESAIRKIRSNVGGIFKI